MKTKVYMLLLALVMVLTMPSCSDFLEEENKTGYTEDLLYGTRAGIDGLVASCYAYSRAWYGKEAALGLSEGGVDTWLTGNDNRQKILVNYSGISPDVSTTLETMNCNFDEYWELFYTAINTCNVAMKQIEGHKLLSDNDKKQYLGEVQFLRAFYYWHLVATWGPVQINREPVSSASTIATRHSELEVYNFILEDLNASIENLAGNTTKNGRVNLWSSKAMKARVLLYKANLTGAASDYSLAVTAASDVITNSGASFYTNYADTWKMANESGIVNKEALFFVTYSDNISENNLPLRLRVDKNGVQMRWTQMMSRKTDGTGGNVSHMMFVGVWNTCPDVNGTMLVRTLNATTNLLGGVDLEYYYSKFSRGFTRYVPSTYLLDLFNDETDQRYQASFRDVYDLAPKLRLTNEAFRTTNKWAYPLCQDTVIYLCKKNVTKDEALAMEARAFKKYRLMLRYPIEGVNLPALYDLNGKPRIIQSHLDPNLTVPGTTVKYTHNDFRGDRIFIELKKFQTDNPLRTENDKWTPEVTGRDYMVIRLAEMYLIKAEAELGSNSGNPLATLNELRRARAITGQNNDLTGAVTINTILDERAIELCGEQQRWFDLKRTGKLIERVKQYNPDAAPNIKDFHVLRPIPTPQMDAVTNVGQMGEAGKFWQNSGY